MVFPHAKEVEDIGLTNQPCKRNKICLVIPKGEAMTHLVLSASFTCHVEQAKIEQNIITGAEYRIFHF
jgi:hypothetical protein